MPRPLRQGLLYFPHDVDASHDEKIEALLAIYSHTGYSVYFQLLERIYRSDNAELEVSDTETIQILARNLSVSEETFNGILNLCLKKALFDPKEYTERHVLTSNGIKKRASFVIEKRLKERDRYKKQSQKDGFCKVSAPETQQAGEFLEDFHSREKEKEKEKEKENRETSKIAVPRKSQVKTNEIVAFVFAHIKDYYTTKFPDLNNDPIPFRDREAKAIKRISERGFTPEQIFLAWKTKTDARKGQYCSMTYVNQDIKMDGTVNVFGNNGHKDEPIVMKGQIPVEHFEFTQDGAE